MEYLERLKKYRADYRSIGIVCGVALAKEKKPFGRWSKAEAMSLEEAMAKGLEMDDLGLYIETGARSGLTVVDLDNKADDFAGFVEKVESLCVGIQPAVVKTGGGGRHYFFRYCLDIRTGAEKKEAGCSGIDIRNDRGIVIAPPTVHASGKQYEFIAGDIGNLPDMPEGLLKWLLERQGKRRGEKRVAEKKHGKDNSGVKPARKEKAKMARSKAGNLIINWPVHEGERNEAMFNHLCSRRGSGYTRNEIRREAERVNQMYMKPSLDSAEMEKIVVSVCRYLPGKRRLRVLMPSKTARNTAQVRAFIGDECTVWRHNEVHKDALYRKYREWSDSPMAVKEFFRILRNEVMVEQSRKGHRQRVYVLKGIGIRRREEKVLYLPEREAVIKVVQGSE